LFSILIIKYFKTLLIMRLCSIIEKHSLLKITSERKNKMDYLSNIENNLKEICSDCTSRGTDKCNYRLCNIGFVDYVAKNIKNNSTYVIEDGERLIPKDDFKTYEEKVIAHGIANVCRLCKNCNENHSENCVISLIRRSLEYTQLREQVTYPGNVIMYLMNIAKQNPEFAELIKEEYTRIA
jgi:hypothetical protein